MKLIIGLGNPGLKYANTRHNMGFMVADRLAGKWRTEFKPESKFKASLAKSQQHLLAKPATMMNLSGEAVGMLMRYFNVASSDILLVHDDIDLAFGRLRIKRGGTSGGHRGVQSVIDSIGPDFWRFRLGIANSWLRERLEPKRFVLLPFTPKEQAALDNIVDQTAEIIAAAPAPLATSVDLLK